MNSVQSSKKSLLKDSEALTETEPIQILFPLNLSSGRYDLPQNREENIIQSLPMDDIKVFLQNVSTKTDNFKTMKPGFIAKRILIFVIIFTLLFGLIIGAGTTIFIDSPDKSSPLVLGLISLSILLCILFFIILISCNILIHVRNKNIHKRIQEVIKEENPKFEIMGLNWKMPNDHYNWIELWIEKKVNIKSTMIL